MTSFRIRAIQKAPTRITKWWAEATILELWDLPPFAVEVMMVLQVLEALAIATLLYITWQ